jgi:hypothetical protein
MSTSNFSRASNEPAHYIPGYVGAKRAMAGAGVLMFLIGLFQLWTPLGLVIFGERAQAEAVRVVKEERGQASLVLTDDVQVGAQGEPHDRTYIFWNEFRFHTQSSGRMIELRASVGAHVKPLYSLTDADGLPTTDWVCYDPARPECAIFPLIISIWLAPCVLIFAGLSCAIIGLVLLRWANKPIALPQLGNTGTSEAPKAQPTS